MYELAILGAPSQAQIDQVQEHVARAIALFGLELNRDVGWHVVPETFRPEQTRSSAVAYFGGDADNTECLIELLKNSVPIVPVVSELTRACNEMPAVLHPLNCLAWVQAGAERVATCLLECAGLLPRQRRVFLSYRRDHARQAALQLFDALSARQFDVFLDTHGVPPAQDFQSLLWHRLCDSDVLVMLDTPGYFDSRWTSAEFGRALAKGISVLRVGWPDATPSIRTSTASRSELVQDEVDPVSGRLADVAVDRICQQLERVRSESHAIRQLNLVSNVRNAIVTIGGQFLGVGPQKAIYLQLPDGRQMVAYPKVGVPTSESLHEAEMNSPNCLAAVVYDSVGLLPAWQNHLDWLGSHVHAVQWVKSVEVAWQLADWRGGLERNIPISECALS